MAQQIFKNALIKYGAPSTHPDIELYKDWFNKVITHDMLFVDDNTYAITTDPGEDSDDPIMWEFCFTITTSNLVVIVSGGYMTPLERFKFMKEQFPKFKNAEFNIPFNTGNNIILFLEDGCELTMPLDGYLNAGPCHSRTLASIGYCLRKISSTKVITVGALDNSKLGSGINQLQTDELGKLFSMKDVWNNFIESLYNITVKNLSVELSRYILIPNPELTKGFECMRNEQFMSQLVDNTYMFLASRPNPEYGLRVNIGNSIIDAQLVTEYPHNEDYEAGLIKLQEYIDLAKSKNLSSETYESAAIPIMATHMLGGRYIPGQFGWAPGDEQAKKDVKCLTRESVSRFKSNVRKLKMFTPPYDVLGFCMLFNS